jgi:SAM-dependent methyltransferase
MDDFRTAVLEALEGRHGHSQYEHWRDYALSSLDRGRELVTKLQREFTGSWKDRRHLDIGSGWGGTCLAAAEAGATSMGIEIGEQQLRVARTLQERGDLDVAFDTLDVMDWEQVALLGRFDVITCDNVIEHVAVPDVLIAHLRRLIRPHGLIYLTVPNGMAVGQMRSDCHYGLLGASLLDPWDGAQYLRETLGDEGYDVSFNYRYETYERLLSRYGLHGRLLNVPEGTPDEVEALERSFGALLASVGEWTPPPQMGRKVEELVDVHRRRWVTDKAYYDQLTDKGDRVRFASGLVRDYGLELWYFVASPDRSIVNR